MMTRFFKNLFTVALGLAAVAANITSIQACPRGGGGYRGGYSSYRNYYRPPVASYTAYYQRPPVQSPPPVVHQMPASQFPQGAPNAASAQSPQPWQQSPPAPVQNQPTNQAMGQAVSATMSANFGQQQPTGQSASHPQMQTGQSLSSNSTSSTNPSSSAQPSTSSNTTGAATSSGGTQSAQQTALEALKAFAAPDSQTSASTTSPQSQPVPFYVGTWTSAVSADISVQLTLNADGSFRWVANAKGKVSEFEGNYTLNNGALALQRSGDNKTMTGSLARTDGGFRFTQQGNETSGLSFTRG